MRNDVILFSAIIIFIFVIWLYTGGPSHPISFAGPYLTPVTTTGGESQAYGPEIDSVGSFWNSWTSDWDSGEPAAIPAESTSAYAGKVSISDGDLETRDVRSEYVELRSDADSDITITGWQLVSSASGAQVRIPEGKHGDSNRNRPVELSSGERAYITTGSRAPAGVDTDDEDTWYVYLGKSRELWPREENIITLLDESGKVVDQYSY